MPKNFKEKENFSELNNDINSYENYYLTIFDDNGLTTINLNEFNKDLLHFGKNSDNDIVINSCHISEFQGVLKYTEYGFLALNMSESCSMIGNCDRVYKDLYLTDGCFLKFINNDILSYTSNGAVIIVSIGKNIDEWKNYSLKAGENTLGSRPTCNIVLPPAGVAKHHASIFYSRNNFIIQDDYSINGTFVNGLKVPHFKETPLKNLDVIVIGNSKLLLYNDKIYYQIFEKGVKLDAINIVKCVRTKFKPKIISSHVNMTINPGEFVAFVGGSGAGKSTFMKCISGVTKPTSGKVFLNGANLYENYDSLKYDIGYVPQDDIVFPNLTLIEMLNYAAKLRMPDSTSLKERATRISKVLDIVQLKEFKDSYIRQLSGGQRKRASIAVELIADPGLLFLDEPTSGLDPGTERSIMQTLQKMSKTGKTVVLVTHNTLNLHLCDKIAFFGSGGRLCFFGPPNDALAFFQVDDFVDIYTLLNENTTTWHKKYESYVLSCLKDYQLNEDEIKDTKKTHARKQKKSFFKQLFNLISRYIKLTFNDFQQLLLLFAQAPLIGYLLTLVANDTIYKNYEDTKAILFSMGCACIWLGLLNSVQEICKEKIILQKEHMADLKLSAYLLSKFIVQGVLAFIQATLLVFVFQQIIGQSDYNILFNSYWDIQLICFLSILSAASLGLFISSIVKNANIAMTIIPLILVPQLLFSGILFELNGITEKISNIILCRWSVEGLGTSVNLNELTHLVQELNPLAEIEPEAYFEFTSEHMIEVITIISLMTLILIIASYISLRKNVDKSM